MQYKPELLRLSEQVGDFRVISSDRLKAFLDASKIMVPKDKVAPIARYYAPPVSPRTSEAFALAHGDPEQKVGMPHAACAASAQALASCAVLGSVRCPRCCLLVG